jgi:hypothetical protein
LDVVAGARVTGFEVAAAAGRACGVDRPAGATTGASADSSAGGELVTGVAGRAGEEVAAAAVGSGERVAGWSSRAALPIADASSSIPIAAPATPSIRRDRRRPDAGGIGGYGCCGVACGTAAVDAGGRCRGTTCGATVVGAGATGTGRRCRTVAVAAEERCGSRSGGQPELDRVRGVVLEERLAPRAISPAVRWSTIGR